jgi:hypothetical protein
MARKVECVVAKADSVGWATSVSQPEAPIGVTVPMYSRPASEKRPVSKRPASPACTSGR